MTRARSLLALALLAAIARGAAAAPDRPEGFGDDARAFEAWLAFEQAQPIRARELAEQLLAGDPGGFAAHCLLARSLRRSEGNPAPALRHARQCRALFEARHGAEPPASAPWYWHRFALYELYASSEELERHADSLRYLDALERYYPGRVDAFRGWPLLSLGRLAEGRAAAGRALDRDFNAVQVAKAWTVLCALEPRAGDLRAAYAACRSALETGPNPDDRAVRLVNTAEAARALEHFGETESLLQEATRHFNSSTLAAPWLELVELYVSQARLPEARAAWREMLDWQRRQAVSVRAHSGARHDRTSALFLLAVGQPVAAARIAERALDTPDRASDLSTARAELASAAALVARAACLAAAEQRLEEATWSDPRARLLAWLDGARLRACAWRAERRAAALQARAPRYVPGALQLPEWLEPDVVEVAGAGVMQDLRERNGNRPAHLYEAEISSLRGAAADALAHASAALARTPEAEVLVRARAAVLAGSAALELGDAATSADYFSLALRLDGGALRRARRALPVSFEPDESAAARIAARVLRGSRRLSSEPGGLRLELRSSAGRLSAHLREKNGAELLAAEVESPADVSPLQGARRLAAAFHARAFAPLTPRARTP